MFFLTMVLETVLSHGDAAVMRPNAAQKLTVEITENHLVVLSHAGRIISFVLPTGVKVCSHNEQTMMIYNPKIPAAYFLQRHDSKMGFQWRLIAVRTDGEQAETKAFWTPVDKSRLQNELKALADK